jgi:hypothetical protein
MIGVLVVTNLNNRLDRYLPILEQIYQRQHCGKDDVYYKIDTRLIINGGERETSSLINNFVAYTKHLGYSAICLQHSEYVKKEE